MIPVNIDDSHLELYGDAVVCDIVVNGHAVPFAFTLAQWQLLDSFSGKPSLPCGWVQKNGEVLTNREQVAERLCVAA